MKSIRENRGKICSLKSVSERERKGEEKDKRGKHTACLRNKPGLLVGRKTRVIDGRNSGGKGWCTFYD